MSLCIAPAASQHGRKNAHGREKWILAGCIAVTLLAAIVPFTRAWFKTELCYNEGWNVYNAALVAGHKAPYAHEFTWTFNNYPMLSFVIMAHLHRWTHDYLFTARALSLLSLIGCGLLTGAIVHLLTQSRRASLLAGLFCVAMFCANADAYVGMDDPQMLSQVFFLGGLYVALAGWKKDAAVAGAALLFVVGGCIKHNLIDFPLAVLVALAMVSLRRAAVFAICGTAFLAAAIALNIHYGGPYFLDILLLPRHYSVLHALKQVGTVLGPLLVPLMAAAWMAVQCFRDERRRTVSLLLLFSFLIGGGFSGGRGVSTNAFFSVMLAICILLGILLAEMEAHAWQWSDRRHIEMVPLAMFGWLMIPLILCGNWNPVAAIEQTRAAAQRFDQEVAALRSHSGPTLCESLLRCYFAGKDYIYDPFNSTRLVNQGKLDGSLLVKAVRNRNYAAVQLEGPIDSRERRDRFTADTLAALEQNYFPAEKNEDGIIYLPLR